MPTAPLFSPHRAFGRRIAHLLAAFSLATASGWSLAAPEPQFQAAFQQFQSALQGDSGAVDKANEAFAALLKAEPADPVLMAYSGAATTLRAGTTMLPWKKMNYAEEGLAQIDKALALLQPAHDALRPAHPPASLETRFVAANTFLALPGMFNRGPRGAKLMAELLASPLLAQAPLPFQGAVWMRAAQSAEQEKRLDEARRHYQLVIDRSAPQAAQAGAKLKALQS
jgi:tetratricopeptide (TPR) repeat protein